MNLVLLGLLLLFHQSYTLASTPNALREEFSESLKIRPTPDGKLYTHFEFRTLLREASPRDPRTLDLEDEAQHYTVFPLALGQLLRQHAVTELHLSLNAGKWNYESWGFPEDSGVGTGASLWTWMGRGGNHSIEERWAGITNGLAGIFCASLSSLDSRRTVSPPKSFRPEGDLPFASHHELLYAPLPSESICTENLTPFLKLLPCKSLSGIASLLNPHKLFDADWHGMGVNVVWSEKEGVEVRLTFGAVFDPVRLSGDAVKRDWSFRSVFGRTITSACPVVKDSLVTVDQSSGGQLFLEPTSYVSGIAEYDLSRVQAEIDVAVQYPETHFKYPSRQSIVGVPLSIQRFLTGGGQSRGGLSILITNKDPTQDLEVVYLESMPWFIKFYLHTLTSSVHGEKRNDLIKHTTYIPPSSHTPTLLELTLRIPSRKTLQLTLEFEKSLIGYTEHPPDASRGWDLPPAVLSFIAHKNTTLRMWTPTLLVDLPTPDFSMPYNVIIMSSTLIALFFGSVFNLLTRKFVWIKLPTAAGSVEESQKEK